MWIWLILAGICFCLAIGFVRRKVNEPTISGAIGEVAINGIGAFVCLAAALICLGVAIYLW